MKRGMRDLERRTIIVHNPPAASIQGVLVHAYRDCLVLGAARSLDDEQDLKGEIRLPWGRGVWVQIP